MLAISIHALREEGDATFAAAVQDLEKFLSTPSARRATLRCAFVDSQPDSNFYPRPPRGGRHLLLLDVSIRQEISIHALREEGDIYDEPTEVKSLYFYPRPPRGGRPATPAITHDKKPISIHALREEGDQTASLQAPRPGQFLSTPSARRATHRPISCSSAPVNFYPRPPRGGRPLFVRSISSRSSNFYPRPPRGGRR